MAKINGVEVKNLKEFTGHEGVCCQGNVYKDGKKLGFWSQDGWGGPDMFDFDESLLLDAGRDYQAGFPDDYKYREFAADADCFLYAVVKLKYIESDCKKAFRKGWKAVFYMNDGFHYSRLPLEDVMTVSEVETEYPRQVAEMRSAMFKNGHSEHVFTPGDFDLTVDKDHPAPEYLKSN